MQTNRTIAGLPALFSALFAGMLWSSTLAAQSPPGVPAEAPPPAHPPSVMDLLNEAAVQGELQMTPAQQQKIQLLLQSLRSDFQRYQAEQNNPPPGDNDPEANKAKAALMLQKYKTQMDEVLSPQQKARLRQLSLRVRGASSVLDPEVAQGLRLTDAQSERITKLVDQARIALRDVRRSPRVAPGRAGRLARREQIREIRTGTEVAIRQTLTPEQNATFDKMLGGQFDFNSVKSEDAQRLEESIDLGAPESAPPAQKGK